MKYQSTKVLLSYIQRDSNLNSPKLHSFCNRIYAPTLCPHCRTIHYIFVYTKVYIQGGSVSALFTGTAYRVQYFKLTPKETNQDVQAMPPEFGGKWETECLNLT